MLGELKDYFINQLCFSSSLTGLTSMMSFQKSSKVSVPAFCPQILVSKLLCFENFAHAQKQVFREACRFYFDYFHLSVHSFIRNRNHYKTIIFLGGRGLYHPPLSNLLFYIANYIWNIKVFPNVMKKFLFTLYGRFLSST